MAISVTVGKTEKRQFVKYESDGYEVSITADVETFAELEAKIESLFELVRRQLESRNRLTQFLHLREMQQLAG